MNKKSIIVKKAFFRYLKSKSLYNEYLEDFYLYNHSHTRDKNLINDYIDTFIDEKIKYYKANSLNINSIIALLIDRSFNWSDTPHFKKWENLYSDTHIFDFNTPIKLNSNITIL